MDNRIIAEIAALHENAIVAWDRDCATFIRNDVEEIVVGAFTVWAEGRFPGNLRYDAIGGVFTNPGRAILFVDPSDPLGVRWHVD